MSYRRFAIWCLMFFYRVLGLPNWLIRAILEHFYVPYTYKGCRFWFVRPIILNPDWKVGEVQLQARKLGVLVKVDNELLKGVQ